MFVQHKARADDLEKIIQELRTRVSIILIYFDMLLGLCDYYCALLYWECACNNAVGIFSVQ